MAKALAESARPNCEPESVFSCDAPFKAAPAVIVYPLR